MNPKRLSPALYCFLTLLIVPVFAGSAFAQHERAFFFSGADGSSPSGGLVVDAEGNFYGSTALGGTDDLGVVYEIGPTSNGGAAETVLYSFTGSNGDGANPTGNLIFDSTGNLYGVTQYGGTGNGAVFELSPPSSPGGDWAETVLYSFQGGPSDGAGPMAGLVLDGAGNLYGTGFHGGIDAEPCDDGGCGVVYELTPPSVPGSPWTESVLYMFQGNTSGGNPMAPLIFDQAGNLYGTTFIGGDYYNGMAFELSPPTIAGGAWTETRIHSFRPSSDGEFPQTSLTLGPGSVLFGTTSAGGVHSFGTAFALELPAMPGNPWGFAVIQSFDLTDGSAPSALTLGGGNTLWGTAGDGGNGIVFQLSYSGGSWTETVLYRLFSRAGPGYGAILYKNALYSATPTGGYKNNGTVFQLSY